MRQNKKCNSIALIVDHLLSLNKSVEESLDFDFVTNDIVTYFNNKISSDHAEYALFDVKGDLVNKLGHTQGIILIDHEEEELRVQAYGSDYEYDQYDGFYTAELTQQDEDEGIDMESWIDYLENRLPSVITHNALVSAGFTYQDLNRFRKKS